MSSTFSLWLVSPVGERLLLIDRVVRIETTLSVNNIGLAKIRFPAKFDLAQYVQEDSRLEIWRNIDSGGLQIDGDTVWLIRDWSTALNRSGLQQSVVAFSSNDLLGRPIVAYPAGSAQSSKSNVPIDDLMKAVVRENLGNLATDPSRDFSITVAPDLSAAPATSKSFAWRNVLGVLQDLAQDADEQGVKVFFGLVYNPNTGGFEFQTRVNQWGVDRSQPDDNRVLLSVRSGTLSEVKRDFVSSQERNVIYVGGRGEEAERDIETVIDTTRLGVAPMNRRERFVNSSGTGKGDTVELQAVGDSALKSARVVEIFSAKVRDNRSVKEGREYKFGDRTLMEDNGVITPVRVDTIKRVVFRGRQTINVGLRGD